jgi:DNA-binding winged helix-turn-helix (wHTH) protein
MTVPPGELIGGRGSGAASDSAVHIDELGVLRRGGAWISLSPTQEAIVRVLVEHVGEAVARGDLAAAAWPSGGPLPHGIDVHIHKLRPRLAELGLVIHTLRGRGYMLEFDGGAAARKRR